MAPLLLLTGLLLGKAAATPPPPLPLPATAEVIQASGPHIACQPPWCAATIWVDAPPEEVLAILMDFKAYPKVFPRVRSVELLQDGRAVHITLAMPFPLADRDYVVQMQGEGLQFAVVPMPWPEVPGVVRLPAFAGRWALVPDQGGTTVRYLWHTDLGADIPDWAVRRAWVTQGNEILLRLRDAAEARPPG